MARKQPFMLFKDARAFARTLGLKSRREWYRFAKTDGKPKNIPTNPSAVYADKGWISWKDFFGVPPKVEFYTYEEARKYVIKLGLKNRVDWDQYAKSTARPPFIPRAPWCTYKNKGWKNLSHFLGNGKDCELRPFEHAKDFVKSKKFKSRKEFRAWKEKDFTCLDIPKDADRKYASKGWISWNDFLGTNNIKNIRCNFCSFEEARAFVGNLGLANKNEYEQWAKTDSRPADMPYDPRREYKGNGWKGWGNFLGTGRIANQNRKWRPFREARAYMRSKNFKNQNEYLEWKKTDSCPGDIPKYPNEVYEKAGWKNWDDWLGTANAGWTIENIRQFVSSLLPNLENMTPAALYVLAGQGGLLDIASCAKGHSFVKAFKTGRFPKGELEKFVDEKPSLVDDFLVNHDFSFDENLESIENCLSEFVASGADNNLPIVECKDILASLNNKFIANADAEAVDFFIKEAVWRIWQHAFFDEREALKQIEQCNHDVIYHGEVKRLFLEEYHGSYKLVIPDGYTFPFQPNLMQRYVAYLVKIKKRIGNWSGTGAGKTLSAILASRVIGSKITVICCPNNVVDNWERNIKAVYPGSDIAKKDLIVEKNYPKDPKYIILNYEFFQQAKAEVQLKEFLAQNNVDFVVIDEIHFTKQRTEATISRRRAVVSAFLSEANNKNPDISILGMSATPVINNLLEGKVLIEMVTGVTHCDLDTKATVSNCVSLYKKFVLHGIRWVPLYDYKLNTIIEDIDCSSYIHEIKQHYRPNGYVDLESILTKAKIPFILENLKPKTIIYTHYLKGILGELQEAIKQKGWKVAIFTGDSKDGLNEFIDGDADVLIASSCIGAGIDRLQYVCNRLIINSLPWTHAEFEQLKGRIYRQGQKSKDIDIIIPLTFADINGQRWSWCQSRWKRIKFKKSIGDAAVDGILPEGHLRSPAQAYKDAMQWIERLENGNINEIERSKILLRLNGNSCPLPLRRIGDITRMNQQINKETSQNMHKRFINNPQEWHAYHAAYRQVRKEWEIIPYQEAIKWCKQRPHMVIGDFGCGEAFLADELENIVYSFDHVAINDKVIACDMAHVPLEDECLDAAIFSLSLMGTNYIDYLREAHRCLKLDGHLWIAESTSRIKDIGKFKELLERLGFDVRCSREKWKFTFIEALKSDREINEVALKVIFANSVFA